LLFTPVLWLVQLFVILFLIGFFWPSTVAWLERNTALNVGTWLGIISILLSPLSKKSRADFRADFDRSYGRFCTGVSASSDAPPEAQPPLTEASVTRTRATMTVHEAERILDIVSAALQDETHPPGRHPVSPLQGYDIFDIMTALKLRIANEFLLLSGRPDFEAQFAEGLKLYDSIPWQIMSTFVADDQLGQIGAKLVMSAVDPATIKLDKRFAEIETGSSFGDFCRSVGAGEPNYWQYVYERAGIDYTSDSPSGNRPIRLNA
jgi:hypothetical protein